MRRLAVLCSDISHMPLLTVWRDSGITELFGIELEIDVAEVAVPGRPVIPKADRAEALLSGRYQIVSGLHREPYLRRLRGDDRLIYVAQTQNAWDDRLIASPTINGLSNLKGRTIALTSMAPCVVGNLRHAIGETGVDPETIRYELLTDGDGRTAGQRAMRAIGEGRAAAALVDMPFDRIALQEGLVVLPLPTRFVIHNVTVCLDRIWATANDGLVVALLTSLIGTIEYFKTRPVDTVDLLASGLGDLIGVSTREDLEYLQAGWAALLETDPFPDQRAVVNAFDLDLDAARGVLDPFDPWDLRYLEAAAAARGSVSV